MSFLSRRACITGATLAVVVCVTRHYTSPISAASEFLTLFAAYGIGVEYIAIPLLRFVSRLLGSTLGFSFSVLHGALGIVAMVLLSPVIFLRWLVGLFVGSSTTVTGTVKQTSQVR